MAKQLSRYAEQLVQSGEKLALRTLKREANELARSGIGIPAGIGVVELNTGGPDLQPAALGHCIPRVDSQILVQNCPERPALECTSKR